VQRRGLGKEGCRAGLSIVSARIWYQSFTDLAVDAAYFSRLDAYLRSVSGAGFEIAVAGMQPGDRYLHPITEFRCAAQVIANALGAERAGYDAFVIGHFQEPGLAEARAAVGIPVIGLGEAAMLHALTLGRRIGLVTINPLFIPYHQDQIARHGLQQRVVAVAALCCRDRHPAAATQRHRHQPTGQLRPTPSEAVAEFGRAFASADPARETSPPA
jgi:Asp/Glu/hydantoin racemase